MSELQFFVGLAGFMFTVGGAVLAVGKWVGTMSKRVDILETAREGFEDRAFTKILAILDEKYYKPMMAQLAAHKECMETNMQLRELLAGRKK